MKSNSHGQQRSQGQNQRLCSFDYPALCCITKTHRDSDIRPPAAEGWDICGAQYREATRGKSTADFISKIEGSLQELEEAEYWLELLGESGFFPEDGLAVVRKETGELKGIFVSIVINTKAKSKPPKS
jgi:hypothetical protein